ncbi:MAG: FecR domain-containing protein [Anaerovoracaceae bacterium]
MRKFLGNRKGRLFVLLCCVLLIAGLMTGCGGSGGNGEGDGGGKAGESARTIMVEETNGTTVVLDEENGSTNAYKGMHLFSGNDVTVQKASNMTMLLDMDKYVFAEETSHFWLEASGSSDSSKTVIYLDEGAVLNRIKNPLENGSVYQVDTPNSTMAVRGTVFRVVVLKGKDGQVYTYLQVFDGSVKVDLKNTEGEYNGVSETFDAGQAAVIRGNTDISEFIVGEDGQIASQIDVSSLPPEIVEKLLEYIEDGDEIIIDKEILAAIADALDNANGTGEPADGDGDDNPADNNDPAGADNDVNEEHNWRTVTVRQATCTRQGLVQSVCTICGQTRDRRNTPMKDHKEAARWADENEATCTDAGSQTKSCTVCGTVLKTRKVDALGHKAGDAVTTDATCTEAGSVITSCTVCGEVLGEQVIEALGHQPGEWTVTEPAGYGTSGTKTLSCSVCGQVLEVQTIPPLVPEYVPPVTPSCEHQVKEWTEKPADCVNDGSRTGTCSLCGQEVTETITKLGHNVETWQTDVEATCAKEGSRSGTCKNCKDKVIEAIPKLAHIEEIIPGDEASCEKAGLTDGKRCSVCQEVLVEQEEIPAL